MSCFVSLWGLLGRQGRGVTVTGREGRREGGREGRRVRERECLREGGVCHTGV